MEGPVLVGDVGGTNVRFALAARRDGVLRIEHFQKLPGDDFESFEAALRHYLSKTSVRAEAACFALAGPIIDQEVTLTNRAKWKVSSAGVASLFGFQDVRLINDFHAMARSVPEYAVSSFDKIFPGTPKPGAPMLVAGPGTGFGVATLLSGTDGQWQVMSGEGGHMAYASRTAVELEMTRLLTRDYGYVSNELVASGSGLEEVHRAFCEIYGRDCLELSPEDMRQRADEGDEMFLALIEVRALAVMGAAGDLVLANGALGGVVLAGGVTERISDFLKTPQARERFVSRGPMSPYLEDCPVWLMHDAAAPLIGAAADFEQRSRI
ncbi:MAG: glucokinase [Hyphomonas sp.]